MMIFRERERERAIHQTLFSPPTSFCSITSIIDDFQHDSFLLHYLQLYILLSHTRINRYVPYNDHRISHMELFLCGCEHIRTIPNACVEYHYILTTMYFLIGTHVLGHIHIHVYPSCFVVYLLLSRSESPKMLLFQRVGGVYHSPSQWNQKTREKGNKYKIGRNNLLFSRNI